MKLICKDFGFPVTIKATQSHLKMIHHFIQAIRPCNNVYDRCEVVLPLFKSAHSELCEPCRKHKARDNYKKRKHQVPMSMDFLLFLYCGIAPNPIKIL